ncbi:HD-GYP domain-containing protein [Syntrophomonas palmitatica]|uniref:HD-GYP domain-containing protein n=1 Tax=Syntrophomonas palmitatica TaxID=402877 RepID=UPI0006D035F0|nr:HD-GYP domain-containing protein [Syntrophomonas palmitatica]
MRRVAIDKLESDMIVARPVFNSDGRVLLHTGTVLHENYISRLMELGIVSVYVRDELFEDVDIKDVISEETRRETIQIIKENFTGLANKHKMNVRLVQNTVANIVDELLSNHDVLIQLSDIRAFDDYTFAHSVNVCVLSIMTGITMGYNDTKLRELGIGALMHDVGKTRIDNSLLNKPGDLTAEEYQEIKRHAEYGFNILRQYDEISLLSAHIAFQHHERWDGQGYPRKLTGSDIHEYARIVAVADVFDALMADRPYRASYSLSQTLHIMKRMAGIYLDPNSVNALIANIAVYPVGSVVELSSGNIGIVVDINRQHPTRPVVKVVYDNNFHRLSQPHEVDLSKMDTVIVVRVISDQELAQLRQQIRHNCPAKEV